VSKIINLPSNVVFEALIFGVPLLLKLFSETSHDSLLADVSKNFFDTGCTADFKHTRCCLNNILGFNKGLKEVLPSESTYQLSLVGNEVSHILPIYIPSKLIIFTFLYVVLLLHVLSLPCHLCV